MEHLKNCGGRNAVEIDSSPGVGNFQHTTSDGSEIHGEGTLTRHETGRGKSRKNRIIFNAAQLNALETLFQDAPYPDLELRTKIAGRLEIDESRIMVWFQNRRAKYRRTAKKGETNPNADFRNGQINSPASTGSHDPSHGEQSPYSGSGLQNFVQNIPVSGVEFSTWVNHCHTGGDQSTVIHQSRDMKQTLNNDNETRMHGLSKDVSNQQRTLDWLRTQNSPQSTPRDAAYDGNSYSKSDDVQHTSKHQEEVTLSQHRRFDIREPSKDHERNGSSLDNYKHSSGSIHSVFIGGQENNSRPTSRNDDYMPPNKDVQELLGNHLGEALQRLGAGPSQLKRGIAPFGVQHPLLRYPGGQTGLSPYIHPYPSSPHGFTSNRPIYDPVFRPSVMPSSIQQYHYSQDSTSFYSTQTNEWNRTTQENSKIVTSRARDLSLDSCSDTRISRDQPTDSGLNISPGIRKSPEPFPDRANRKRRRSFSDESEDESCNVKKKRSKRKFRQRRRKIRRETKKTEISLSELANPNRHNHNEIDSDNEKFLRKHPSKCKKNVKVKLRRHASSSWDEAGSSSESQKRSSSSSVFSSTSDSDFEIPYCKLTRNQRGPLSLQYPQNSTRNDMIDLSGPVESAKSKDYLGNLRPSVSKFDDKISSRTYTSSTDFNGSAPHCEDAVVRGTLFNVKKTGTEKVSRDEVETSRSVNDQEQDFEPATLLNLLFGPKSPEIPTGNGSDEDLQNKPLQNQKSKIDHIPSESWQVAQNCSSPPVVNCSAINPLFSTLPRTVVYKGSTEYSDSPVGQVTARNRVSSRRQFTLHYGNNNLNSSIKPQERPRGIIRPVPQKSTITSVRHSTESKSNDTSRNHFQKSSLASTSPSKRITGTVRPWVDDTPRATNNPQQDISRPVREPVPMEGPPPNKVCTIIKDSLSPIDLLAKYLTWTGSCYTAQQGK